MIFSDFKFSFSLRHSLAVYAFSFVPFVLAKEISDYANKG